MTTIALLANRRSGRGPDLATLERCLAGNGATVRAVEQLGELRTVARTVDRVAVAGGDGTIAPAAEVAAGAGLPFAVIALGTANDFARAMELPRELEAACLLAATGDRLRTLDLCRMGDRPFVNAASGGLAVSAARWARPYKRALGPLAYALGALVAGVREPPFACRVTRGDCQDEGGAPLFEGRAWQVIVAGTGAFGAGSSVQPADACDGLLDVVVVEAGSRLHLIRRAYGLRTGTITFQGGVHHARAARVAVHGGTGFNVDGEVLAPVECARFSVEHARLRLVVG